MISLLHNSSEVSSEMILYPTFPFIKEYAG